jgi:predicted transcriptional regulator/ribosome-associated translation inhibitor RaiA
MEIKRTFVLDGSDYLSKALAHLEDAPAVIITRNGKYFGMIDHRSISPGLKDPSKVRCEMVISKPPVLSIRASLLECVEAFMVGHYKALPVVDQDLAPMGVTTRVGLLRDMVREKLIPPVRVTELMSRPVYTIDENETITAAKSRMKENRARRLVVTRRGTPFGVLSVFDISAWDSKANLAAGRKDIHMNDPISLGEMKLSGFLRPDVTLVKEGASLQEAIEKMTDKEVSNIVVVSENEVAGVLSAMDIFKRMLEMARKETAMAISGLPEDDMSLYTHIQEKFGNVLGKFGKSFNIRNPSVHVKRGKSTYVVSIYFDTDDGHVSIKEERGDLREAVNELAYEVSEVLGKKKDQRRQKPRATHVRGKT